MATIWLNSMIKGFHGSIGKLVYRQCNNKIIVSGRPKPSQKQSALQRQNRDKFKYAAAWAKHVVNNPEKKAYYQRKAKKLKLPNAYTAAIKDYLNKGEIKEIDVKQLKGLPGDVIRIRAEKKNFAVNKVNVSIRTYDGRWLESGYAVKKNGVFIYTASGSWPNGAHPGMVRVILDEHVANKVEKSSTILLT